GTSAANAKPGLVRAWDLSTGKELWQAGTMGFDDRGFRVLEFLSDGQSLVLFDRSTNHITVRDRVSGTQRREFATMQRDEMETMALSPDEKFLFIGTTGSAARARELAAGKELPMLGGHKGWASSVANSRRSNTAGTGVPDSQSPRLRWPAGA